MARDDGVEADGVAGLLMCAQDGQKLVRDVGPGDGDEAAFVGAVEGVEAEEVAGRRHRGRNGEGLLVDLDADLGGRGDLVERGGDSAAGGVPRPCKPSRLVPFARPLLLEG